MGTLAAFVHQALLYSQQCGLGRGWKAQCGREQGVGAPRRGGGRFAAGRGGVLVELGVEAGERGRWRLESMPAPAGVLVGALERPARRGALLSVHTQPAWLRLCE